MEENNNAWWPELLAAYQNQSVSYKYSLDDNEDLYTML